MSDAKRKVHKFFELIRIVKDKKVIKFSIFSHFIKKYEFRYTKFIFIALMILKFIVVILLLRLILCLIQFKKPLVREHAITN